MAKKPKLPDQRDQEPIGMVDGELKTYAPGEKIPGPTILGPDGEEMTVEEYHAKFGGEDDSAEEDEAED